MKRLFILVVVLAVAGCRSNESFGLNPERLEETRSAIEATIREPERRVAMLTSMDSFQMEVQKIIAEVTTIRLKIVEANRDYDTTREQLQQLYDELGGQLDRLGDTVKAYSLKLRALCSEAEWDGIFDHDDKAFGFKY